MGANSEMNGSAAPASRGDGPGCEPVDELVVERNGGRVTAKWNIAGFAAQNKASKVIYSKYFEVGGYDCRLLVYPSGDAQALPGYMSVYLQISDPGSSSSKWDCFASYQLAVRNLADDTKSVRRDSWHRFSAKKRSHGWCDFAALSTLLDPKQGFLGPAGTIQVSTDITILDEAVNFTRENDLGGSSSAAGDVYSGKFVWRVRNFSAFQPLLRTQKIMSPAFPAGDCALRMSVYQSTVAGVDYLSLCLESKDTERSSGAVDRTAWCLFRLAVQPQSEDGGKTVHRDSYGRFASDSRGGDNTSLGWNDFMRMSDFTSETGAYLIADTAVFSTTFHVIRESTSLVRSLEPRGTNGTGNAALPRQRDKRKAALRDSEWAGRFQWRLENFTRLKDLLKKRKITGLCIKSRRFAIGGRDCRLIVYPRGQSQPPTFLSVFLEVSDPHPTSPDWSAFVSHRLSVVNQRGENDRSVSKESQNRYSKTAKDWGWREFVSLTTLFDADAGFLVNDSVIFSAEVLVLKESVEVKNLPPLGPPMAAQQQQQQATVGAAPNAMAAGDLPFADRSPEDTTNVPASADSACPAAVISPRAVSAPAERTSFTWRVENFLAFKEVVETRKIFSQFFSAGPCDVRVGLYESFDSLCVYLESDAGATPPPMAPASGDATGSNPVPEKPPSHWVRYKVAIVNQRNPDKTQWREGSMYTRSWNNSVLQFPRIGAPGTSADSGAVLKDCLILTVEILDVRPWSADAIDGNGMPPTAAPGMSQLEAAAARRATLSESCSEDESCSIGSSLDDDEDVGDVDDDDLHDGEAEVEDALGRWLSAAGLELLGIDNHPPLLTDAKAVQTALEDMLASQPGAIPMFVASLRMYMSSLQRVKRLLLPCLATTGATPGSVYGVAPAVISLLAGIPSLRQPLVNMLVDVMLDHTLTAKMHRHLLGGSPQKRDDAQSVADESPESDGAPMAALGTSEASASVHLTREEHEGPSASPEAPPVGTPPATPEGRSARIGGSLAESPPDDVEQTLGLILGWLRSIDPEFFPPPPDLHAQSGRPVTPSSPLSPLHKISMLLADAPPALQADVVALLPLLVCTAEHTAAAGALLGRLAEASREGPEAEAQLRMPVLAALGALQIDPAVAQKVLQAAKEALPNLSASELPPAVGLVLKLASEDVEACKEAVAAVRQRVSEVDHTASSASCAQTDDHATAAGDVHEAIVAQRASSGAVAALRLAAVQHSAVANAILDDLLQQAGPMPLKPPMNAEATSDGAENGDGNSTSEGEGVSEDAPSMTQPLLQADIHVILDCLTLSTLREKAANTLSACAGAGRLDEAVIVACLEARKAAGAWSTMPTTPPPANAVNGGVNYSTNASMCSSSSSPAKVFAMAPMLESAAQRAFVLAHPLADPSEGPMPEAIARQLHLRFPDNTSPAGLPNLTTSSAVSADELGGLLAAGQALLRIKGIRQKQLGAALFKHAYRLCGDDLSARRRVLSTLAKLALSGREISNFSSLQLPDTMPSWSSEETNTPPKPSLTVTHASTPGYVLAARVLSSLTVDSPESAALMLSVSMETALEASQEAQHAAQEAARLTSQHAQQLADHRSALSKAEAARRKAEDRASELQAQLTRRAAEHRAELAGLASDIKDLQAQLRGAEQQVEWVRSERDEERVVRARENRDAAQRLAESEAQLQRLKVQRRDEQKRALKERSVLMDRLKELEEALEAAESRAARVRNEAEISAARKDKATHEAQRSAEGAARALSLRDAELTSARSRIAELDAQLRTATDARRRLEQLVSAEQQRMALLTSGAGLQNASRAELETLANVHQAGLRRINAILMASGGASGALPSHISSLSPSKVAFRSTGMQPQQAQNMGGLAGHTSLDSLQALQAESSGSGGSASLFSGADWGLGPRQSSAPVATAAPDESSLLGLLPSDLLHS